MIGELPFRRAAGTLKAMGAKVAVGVLALVLWRADVRGAAPIYDPIALNIGINCQWQQSCERRQIGAMNAARTYMARAHLPLWRIHLCNKNSRRSPARIDWVGFNACIRNPHLRRPRRSH